MDKYQFDENAEKVKAPIWAIGGDVDPRCPKEQLPEWDTYTEGKCEVNVFPGGHFFLKDNKTEGELLGWLSKTVIEE
jgi:surfactin synthase thioesterase subunit